MLTRSLGPNLFSRFYEGNWSQTPLARVGSEIERLRFPGAWVLGDDPYNHWSYKSRGQIEIKSNVEIERITFFFILGWCQGANRVILYDYYDPLLHPDNLAVLPLHSYRIVTSPTPRAPLTSPPAQP